MPTNNSRIGARCRQSALLALLATGAVLIAACGDDGGGEDATSSGGNSGKQVKLAAELLTPSIPFAVDGGNGIKAATEDDGNAAATVQGPPATDPVKAQKQVVDALAQKPDAIVVDPFPAALWSRTFKAINEALPDTSLAFDSAPISSPDEAPKSLIKLWVGRDDLAQGGRAAEQAIKRGKVDVSTTGTVLVAKCTAGNQQLDARVKGFSDSAKELLPDAKIMTLTTDLDLAANANAWTSALQKNKDVVLTFGACTQDGISQAIVKRKLKLSMASAATELAPQTIAGLKSGTITVAVPSNMWVQGYVAAKLAIGAARGTALPEGFMDCGFTVVDGKTVDPVAAALGSQAAARKRWLPKANEVIKAGTAPLGSGLQ